MKHTCLSLLIIVCTFFFNPIFSQDTINESKEAEETEESVFMMVETMPEFPGGEAERIKFIMENIEYPQKARESGIQGTVYINFIVETDGSITNVRLLRGIGGGCDEEALRVVKMMPKWKPGTQRNKAVRVLFNMPLKFMLNDGKEEKKKKKLNKEEKKELLF